LAAARNTLQALRQICMSVRVNRYPLTTFRIRSLS
jgi:hypothetical protein